MLPAGTSRFQPLLLAVLRADPPVGFAEGNAFLDDERIGFGGGIDRRIEVDVVRPEPYASQGRAQCLSQPCASLPSPKLCSSRQPGRSEAIDASLKLRK